jgi:glyoxylase-like metal-dependent hydrolase (beta-lactamase superfamily II)
MNSLEHALHYPFADTLPESGNALKVAPTIKWLRMPLPFALDHINLWLIQDVYESTKGWAIVDCGIANDATKALWEQVFAQALEGYPITRVICTHMHPDHVGLAHWLCDKWQVPLFMSMTDYTMSRLFSQQTQETTGAGGTAAAAHFARHGLTQVENVEKIHRRASYYSSLVPAMPASFNRLQDNLLIQIGEHAWQCIAGYGHAPEHIALYCAALNVLISGDMVLPRISTNISVWDMEPEGDPLTQFLDSLTRYEALPADTLTLPSHGKPFTGLHERIRQLREHHRDRLAEVLQACASAQTAAQIVPVLFKRALDAHQMSFAMGEALAHLHYLWRRGQVNRLKQGNGLIQFQTVGNKTQ